VLEVSIVGLVAPKRAPVSASDRGTASDYSKGTVLRRADSPALRGLLAALALAGAALLALAEPTALFTVVIGSLETDRRSVSSGSNHGYALVPVALAAVAAAAGAWRGMRAAAPALVALGVAALLVALLIDLPDTRSSAALPESVAFADVRVTAGPGFALELAGAVALLVSGAALLARGRARPA